MSWANVGAALRGIGDTAYNYDRQKREKELNDFVQEQRMRERQKWSDEDKERAMVAAVRPEGEYDEPVTNDPYQEGYTTGKKIKRTVADVQGDMERGYRRLGLADKADAARLRALQYARAEREDQDAAYNRHVREVNDTIWKAKRLEATGDLAGAMRLFAKAYEKDNDGYKIIVDGDQWGVAGPNAQYVRKPEKITPGAIKSMIDQAVEYMSPEMWQAVQNRNFKVRELNQRDTANDIQRTSVDNQAAYQRGNLALQGQRLGLEQTQLGMGAMKGGVPVTDANGNTAFMVPVRNADGTYGFSAVPMPAGYSPQKTSPLDMAYRAVGELVKGNPDATPDQIKRVFDGVMGAGKPDTRFDKYKDLPPPGSPKTASAAPSDRGTKITVTGRRDEPNQDADAAEAALRGKHRSARSREDDYKLRQLDELERNRPRGLYRGDRVQEEQQYQTARRKILLGE